jgi:RNA polymerase sigma-70 factor, ECF subfamily
MPARGARAHPALMHRTLDPQTLGDHVDRLFRAACALSGNRHDAEDLVQETFARVLARPRILRNDDDLGYLLRVMRNTFISRVRTAQRRPRTRELPEHAELVDLRATDHADDIVEAHDVLAHVAALPDVFRDAVVAVDVIGLSYAEAARALRTKEATITSRVHRGRTQVAQRVGGEAPEPERPARRAPRRARRYLPLPALAGAAV